MPKALLNHNVEKNEMMLSDFVVCYKVTVKDFKTRLSDDDNGNAYGNENLKTVYRRLGGECANREINFYMTDGYIYLLPESGEGLDRDIWLIKKALNQMS